MLLARAAPATVTEGPLCGPPSFMSGLITVRTADTTTSSYVRRIRLILAICQQGMERTGTLPHTTAERSRLFSTPKKSSRPQVGPAQAVSCPFQRGCPRSCRIHLVEIKELWIPWDVSSSRHQSGSSEHENGTRSWWARGTMDWPVPRTWPGRADGFWCSKSRKRVGGACTIAEPWPGYRISPCAYLVGLLHPLVIEELDMAGVRLRVVPRDGRAVRPVRGRQQHSALGRRRAVRAARFAGSRPATSTARETSPRSRLGSATRCGLPARR